MTSGWIQLDGVEQILPYDGWEFEQLRRSLLDCLYQNGYELVVPPLVDFIESLLGGVSEDLDLLTVKTPDYVSGKLYGIRADMTPQIARLVACHLPRENKVARLCYLGPTLLAKVPNAGKSREILQYGAELFGSNSIEADCEVIRLMVRVLEIAGIESPSISIGHVGIVDELMESSTMDYGVREKVTSALKRKSRPALKEIAAEHGFQSGEFEIYHNLVELNGGIEVISQARSQLSGMTARMDDLLDEYEQIVMSAVCENENASFHIDYALMGSYQYHSGVVFAAFGSGYGQALVKGGRYDRVLEAYGEACPATGFSGDLRLLRRTIQGQGDKGVLVPYGVNAPEQQITELLQQNNRIIRQLPDQKRESLLEVCDRELIECDGKWKVVPFVVGHSN